MAKTKPGNKAIRIALISVHAYIPRNKKKSGSVGSGASEASPGLLEEALALASRKCCPALGMY